MRVSFIKRVKLIFKPYLQLFAQISIYNSFKISDLTNISNYFKNSFKKVLHSL